MTVQRFDLSSNAYKRNPFPTLAALRAAGPVVTIRMPVVGEISLATTHAAVEKLLKDTENFGTDLKHGRTSRIGWMLRVMPKNLKLLAQNMLQKDGAEHRRLRKLVDGAFRRGAIEAWRPRIEVIADRLLDDWEASDDRDLVRHVARNLPLAVICEMLGLPDADRPKFTRWMRSFSEMSSVWGFFRLLPAIGKINRYLTAAFREARAAEPRDDLMSALVHVEAEGDRLSDDDLLAMLFLLFVAGHETTTHLISGGVLALLQSPDQMQRLRADPGLTPSAVDELLRYVTPVEGTKPRFALHDLEFEGVRFCKGQFLMASLAAANADPAVFEAPETLDIGREKNRHVAFGGGPHFCLGAWLAKAEMEVLLERLIARAPTLALAGPESELRWVERVGMRALKGLPLTV